MRESYRYDIARICLNGHIINSFVITRPHNNKTFCDKCGLVTVTNCLACKAEIRGGLCYGNAVSRLLITLPAFCPSCGKPYPWTEAKIQAAHELAQELENISDDEKKILAHSIDEIAKETPKTTLAATRFKKMLSKTSRPVVDAFRDILVDVASETAKKLIWP